MMTVQKEQRMVVVQRDCPARLVPAGTPLTIPADSFITITQARGGTFTVTYKGNMARVEGADADALGFEPEVLRFSTPVSDRFQEVHVMEALATVFDPEIPVNIVELGLVYGVQATVGANGNHDVLITMTLTSPTCGMGQTLADDVRHRVARVPHVGKVDVNLVFDPPWDREKISDEAKLELGLL
jgi:probable FeS assembly SUF system protein SufT